MKAALRTILLLLCCSAGTLEARELAVVISEIMYHPPNPPSESPYDDEAFEFIELVNRGAGPVDLTGVRFTDGIQFVFLEGTRIASGAYVLIVRDLEAFRSRYNTTGMVILGEYAGYLENRGERLAMEGVGAGAS